MCCVWQVLADKSITKSLRNTKIGRKVAHPTGNNAYTSFKVKRSKIKVSRPINSETESVSFTNFKLGKRLVHALSTTMASYKGLWSWVIARGRVNTVREDRTRRRPDNLVFII